MHSTGDCLEAGQRDQQRKEKPTGGLSTGLRSEGQLRVDILEERHGKASLSEAECKLGLLFQDGGLSAYQWNI